MHLRMVYDYQLASQFICLGGAVVRAFETNTWVTGSNLALVIDKYA